MNTLEEKNKHGQTGIYTNVEELIGLRFFARNIQLSETRSSTSTIDGESRSRYRGRGMEFSEVRPYYPGDDIRNIDWRVTARTQTTYTKLFQEEKERPVYIVVDQRSTMFFASQGEFKSVLAAKLAALIGWAALSNNDRIGAMVFSDFGEVELRAKRGKHAQLNLIHQLVSFNHSLNQPFPEPNGLQKDQEPLAHDKQETTDEIKPKTLADSFKELRHIAKPGSAIFVISDFHDFDESCEESVSMLSRHTDVHLLHVFDQLEHKLPLRTNLTMTDGENRFQLSNLGKNAITRYTHSFESHMKRISDYAIARKIVFSSLENAHSMDTHIEQLFATSSKSRKLNTRAPR